MEIVNRLDIATREEFRQWLRANASVATECWLPVKKGKMQSDGIVRYLDAVEEALCFGWIDSTLKNVDGVSLQRFGRRSKNSYWSELNKERCRRLEKLGLMTDSGRAALPNLDAEFMFLPEILEAFKAHPVAWSNFRAFPGLYQRVRIDNIQRNKACPSIFQSRLKKLIEASERGDMIGDWHDDGRLLDY